MAAEPVYQVLAEHQQTAQRWDLNAVAADLHRWAEIFRLRFKLEIPIDALRLRPLPRTRLGHYYCGYNSFGLQNEIAISTHHIERCRAGDQWWKVLGTLLHEELHLWQQLWGRPGKNNYHNVQYQAKAAPLGLIVDARGYTSYAAESPFKDLLREYGVKVPVGPQVVVTRESGVSKLKRWSCGCTNARVAVPDFQARCLKCGNLFVQQG
jgi:hypothetical protein